MKGNAGNVKKIYNNYESPQWVYSVSTHIA